MLDITKTRISSLWPQSDAIIQRFNRTFLDMLNHWDGERQKTWDEKLLQVIIVPVNPKALNIPRFR